MIVREGHDWLHTLHKYQDHQLRTLSYLFLFNNNRYTYSKRLARYLLPNMLYLIPQEIIDKL